MLRTAVGILLLAGCAPVRPSGRPPPLGQGVADARTTYPPSASLRVTRDIEYAHYGSRRLLLDLYLPPADGSTPLPVVVVVRGGGWHAGDEKGFAFVAGYLANAGFATVCIEYRPTEEATFPAAAHDVNAAIRWVRANAIRFQLDSNRIGGSAGGQLVALAATSPDDPALEGIGGSAGVSSRLTPVVAMAPVTDFRLTWSQGGKDGVAFLGPGLTEGDERLGLASPVTHVGQTAAPLLLMHSRQDPEVPYRQSLDLKARYEAVVRPVELVTFDSAPHASWNDSRWFPVAMSHAVTFFRRTFSCSVPTGPTNPWTAQGQSW